jgi:hypothetical protein
MSGENKQSMNLQRPLDRLLNGDLSDDEKSQLELALRNHPDAIDYFLDYCQLHIDLAIDLSADRAVDCFCEHQQQVAAPINRTLIAPPPVGADDDVLAPPGGRSFFALSSFSLGMIFCALALVAVAGVVWWSTSSALGHAAAPATLAGEIQTPSVTSVQIDSGSTKLELSEVGTVVVEGPANFELTGPMRARLQHGRIRMHVTKATGHGFVVETPFGNVKDLGTEFGLDVSNPNQAGVVVFDGEVDLEVAESNEKPDFSRVERLVRGEGLTFGKGGQLDRIMSIITGPVATFEQCNEPIGAGQAPIILQVADNRRTGETKKFYEIVPGGLKEDSLAYVDRKAHEWNGLTKSGMPSYLIGADYVKMFSEDRSNDVKISVTLSCPARVFLFYHHRLPKPDWLEKEFRDTGDQIGLDVAPWKVGKRGRGSKYKRGKGAGDSVDVIFSVWERVVAEPGAVEFGPNASFTTSAGMYGIAAIRNGREEIERNNKESKN